MLWQGRRGSGNVEDRRGIGGPVAVGGGIIGVIVLVLNFLLGGNADTSQIPLPGAGGQAQQLPPEQQAAEDQRAQFAKVVLADTEDVWNTLFQKAGSQYQEPRMVLFRQAVQSGCGQASAASGPFYCPADQKLYIDLSFYEELQNRFQAPGDFAMAYVIAHEVGHHIQYLMGTSEKMARLRQRLSEEEYNQYSVRLELQADFYAGAWAHYAQQIKSPDGRSIIEPGDIEEALNAANAIGDDRLQQQSRGHVVPESFTHGTSAQRMYWFRKGFETGDISQGDTFNATRLE
jgi:predicted metalloprotease